MLSNPVYLRRLFRLSPSLSGIIARHSSRVMAKILPSVRPCVSTDEAVALAERFYGFRRSENVAVKELDSYDDRNFYLKGKLHENEEENEYVLKVMGTRDSYDPGFLDAVDQAMLHFSGQECGIQCPVPIQSLTGAYRHKIELKVSDPKKTFSALVNDSPSENNNHFKQLVSKDPLVSIRECKDGAVDYFMPHYVRLLSFVPGETLDKLEHINDDLFWECGVLVAKVQNAFKDFSHPSLIGRQHLWNLSCISDLLPMLDNLKCLNRSDKLLLKDTILVFSSRVLPILNGSPKQTIHADLNDANLVIYRGIKGLSLAGIIDFGDIIYEHKLFELGIALTYVFLLEEDDPLHATAKTLSGFSSVCILTDHDLHLVLNIMLARFAQSIIVGYYTSVNLYRVDTYVTKDAKKSIQALRRMSSMPQSEVVDGWRRYLRNGDGAHASVSF